MADAPDQPATDLRRFLWRLFWFCSPFVLLVTAYAALDPFKMLRRYDDYSIRTPGPMLNRDRISTEKFLADHPRLKFDSFIFGNSRSLALHCGDWKEIVPGISPFHFDATGENLYGIARKMEFLDKQGASIRRVIMGCDTDLLNGTEDLTGHLFIKDHRVTGSSAMSYHLIFLRAWCLDFFFARYTEFLINGKMRPSLKGYFEERDVVYLPDTNDNLLPALEKEIAADPAAFQARNRHIFYTREAGNEKINPAVISPKGLSLLRDMKRVGEKHGTDFKIIVNPLYNQLRLNPADLAALREVFGTESVFDFSGINEFTSNVDNYYETSHYRPHIGRQILERIQRP